MDDMKAELDGANQKIAAVQKQLDELEKLGINPGKIEELGTRLKELADAKVRLETELAEAKQVQEALNQKAAALEGEVQTKDNTITAYKHKLVQPGLTGRVLAYNPGWNFVVLSIGDKAGLKSGVNMVVTRGGAMIGKVRVTTVEPNTAIADVLPGTLAKGESVQPGDSVIYEGKR
jgi:hypothetical protein